MRKRIRKIIEDPKSFVKRLWEDPFHRMRYTISSGAIMNLLYAIMKIFVAVYTKEPWFLAVGVYYLILSGIRVLLGKQYYTLCTHKGDPFFAYCIEMRAYRMTGIVLIFLVIGLNGMLLQMVRYQRGFVYPGIMIYASAVFAFYFFIMALIGLIRNRNLEHPIRSAYQRIGFSAAMVSILALQTAMLSRFGNSPSNGVYNFTTGCIMGVIVIVVSIRMIYTANRFFKDPTIVKEQFYKN